MFDKMLNYGLPFVRLPTDGSAYMVFDWLINLYLLRFFRSINEMINSSVIQTIYFIATHTIRMTECIWRDSNEKNRMKSVRILRETTSDSKF